MGCLQNKYRDTKLTDMETDIIKEDFYNAKPSGRLLPMTVAVTDKEKLKEVLPVLLFKKNLK